MGRKKKDDAAMDVFALLEQQGEARRQREREAALARMRPHERAELGASVMAAGMILRCLGQGAEAFGERGLFERLQERVKSRISFLEKDGSARPFLFGRPSPFLRDFELDKRKQFHSIVHWRNAYANFVIGASHAPVVFDRAAKMVRLHVVIEQPERVFAFPRGLDAFQLTLQAGLVSDMVYSAAAREYVYVHPEWQGRSWCVQGEILGGDVGVEIDMGVGVEVPDFVDGATGDVLGGGLLPEGLHLVAAMGIWFYRRRGEWMDGPFHSTEGMRVVLS